MEWRPNHNNNDGWWYDGGLHGCGAVYNTRPTEPTGHWRATWCDTRGTLLRQQEHLADREQAQRAVEDWLVAASGRAAP